MLAASATASDNLPSGISTSSCSDTFLVLVCLLTLLNSLPQLRMLKWLWTEVYDWLDACLLMIVYHTSTGTLCPVSQATQHANLPACSWQAFFYNRSVGWCGAHWRGPNRDGTAAGISIMMVYLLLRLWLLLMTMPHCSRVSLAVLACYHTDTPSKLCMHTMNNTLIVLLRTSLLPCLLQAQSSLLNPSWFWPLALLVPCLALPGTLACSVRGIRVLS